MLISQGLITTEVAIMHIRAPRRVILCFNSSKHSHSLESKVKLVLPLTHPNMPVATGTQPFSAISLTSLRCLLPMLMHNATVMLERSSPAKDSIRSRSSESLDQPAVPMVATQPQAIRVSALTAKVILGHIVVIAHQEEAQATQAVTTTILTRPTRTISREVTVGATENRLARLSNSIRPWSSVVQQVGSMLYWMNFLHQLQQITSTINRQQPIYFYKVITIIKCIRHRTLEDRMQHIVTGNSGKISSVKSQGTSTTSLLSKRRLINENRFLI